MYSISDWAILNDTKTKQLERILVKFHHLSESEITLACVLLESYHAVYRPCRLMHRRQQIVSGQEQMPKPCAPPTPKQLQEIAQRVNAKVALNLKSQDVTVKLQDLAKCLQQYRRHVRTTFKGTASQDQLNHHPNFNAIRSNPSKNNGYTCLAQMYPL